MVIVDTSENPRIPIILEMARRLSSTRGPNEVLEAFMRGMHDAFGMEGYIRLATMGLPPGQFRIMRQSNVFSIDLVEDEAPELYPVWEGGFLSAVIRTPGPKLVRDLDLDADPILGDAFKEYSTAMAVPMFFGGEATHWLVLFHRGGEFGADDLEENLLQVAMLSSSIRTALIAKKLSEATRRIQGEVKLIAGIQRALIPSAIPDIPGLTGAAHYETFEHAGGDYYDFRPLRMRYGRPDPRGPWSIIIADAAGHGPAAAVVMAMLRTLFHGYGQQADGPGDLLEYCNRHLNSADMRFAFVTAFAGEYDPVAHTLRYARAGHEPPLMTHAEVPGIVHRLDAVNGFPLGVEPRVNSDEAVVELAPGQTLLLYTDGITEAFSPDGAMFSVEGIERALAACNGQADCVVSTVVQALKDHEAGVRPRDDQTLVALRVLNGQPGLTHSG